MTKVVETAQMAERKRNYGIDLLRIVSMIMIVLLHIIGQGGVLENTEFMSVKYSILYFLKTASFCSVNCYALISGYVGLNSKFKYRSIIELYFTVIFYTLGITAVFAALMPGTVNVRTVIKAIIPFLGGGTDYWYFTAYTCSFFFYPYLKYMVESLERKKLRALVFIIIFFFSVVPAVFDTDIFATRLGYSPMWLALMYLIGAYIKKYDIGKNMGKLKCFFIILICLVITWIAKLVFEIIVERFFKGATYGYMIIQYTSPLILCASVFLVILFSKAEFGKINEKIIAFFAPLAFSVYIIHCEPLIWKYVILERFSGFAELNVAFMVIAMLLTVFGIWLICSLIDVIRFYLFKILKIGNISAKIERGIAKIIKRFICFD